MGDNNPPEISTSEREHLEMLRKAILEGDPDGARQAAVSLKGDGVPANDVVGLAIKPAMDEVGRRYDRLEAFLPELVMAGLQKRVSNVCRCVQFEGTLQ